jgi:hypothetical protein
MDSREEKLVLVEPGQPRPHCPENQNGTISDDGVKR